MARVMTVLMMAGGILMVGAWTPDRATAPSYKATFCPECWKFAAEGPGLDLQGRCRGCGKVPVTVEAVTVSWFWCRPHQAWHRRPCSREPLGREQACLALLAPAGSEPLRAHAYCPADRALMGLENVGLRCPVCAKPLVRAETVERRWHWCATEKTWLTEPCSLNRVARCCTPRSGAVLAYPLQLPIPHPIALRAPYRNDLLVAPEWLAAHLDDPHLVVLHIGFDPQDAAEPRRPTYLDGHIPGARSVAWNEIARTRDGIPNELPSAEDLVALMRALGIDADDRIVLYDTGAGLEAARAFFTLDYLGLAEKASILDGQWALWKGMDLPQTGMPTDLGEPSAFVPKLRPEILVSLRQARDVAWVSRLIPTTVALLDARTEAEFSGLKAGKGIRRAGHIAGAANLCWRQIVISEEDPVFRSEDELRILFEQAGAKPGRAVVVYCRTGVDAALLYFVAKYLGYSVQMYDGSYYEWSWAEESPVEGGWARR